ncbi:hypothetical protein SLE2022_235630 [Rubroshorea leprosula]
MLRLHHPQGSSKSMLTLVFHLSLVQQALGVVLRDSNSGVLGASKKTISFQGSVTHTEVLAISFEVQLRKEFGHKNVVVESDSMNAVQVATLSDECYLMGSLLKSFKNEQDYLIPALSNLFEEL